MEFHEKLQQLRKSRGLTQEALAEALFVSRTAISKWESGRGYPNIDSLQAIAKFFSVTVDVLLSGDQVLTLAKQERKAQAAAFRDLVFGLMDLSSTLFFFVPLFGQSVEGFVRAVPLTGLTQSPGYLLAVYYGVVAALVGFGILTLVLQNCRGVFWTKNKSFISLGLNGVAALLFILSTQPYAAAFAFLTLTVKVAILLKKP
jgi:transcriptional regulator with XRE-family HTH domain